MAGARWFNEADNRRLVELHRQGLTDVAIAAQMDRGAPCIATHRKALGIKANTAATRLKRAERILGFIADPELASERQERMRREPLGQPAEPDPQFETPAEKQARLAEEREEQRTKIPHDDPLLEALWRVHGHDIQARREREARA